METPLTPLDFLRRAGKLYAGRLAVVDGDTRLTYAQFGERCDRWTRVSPDSASAKAIESRPSRPIRISIWNSSTDPEARRRHRADELSIDRR